MRFLQIIVHLISLLPLAIIRLIIAPIAFWFTYVIPYRAKVVEKNLAIAFPEKSAEERKNIQRLFYHSFFEMVAENIKAFTISEEDAAKRLVVTNPHEIDKYFEKGKSVIMVFGHYNNWELTPLACPSQIKHQITAIYQPIKNKKIDNWIKENRSRTGVHMMSTKEVDEFYQNNQKCVANTFIADQSPSRNGHGIWVDFFNRPTLFLAGAAVYAQKMNHPIVFIDIQKIKKDHYQIIIEDLVIQPKDVSLEEIIQRFAHRMEKQIRQHPEYWLWSHNRWKHNK